MVPERVGDEFGHGGNGVVGERAAGQEDRDEVPGGMSSAARVPRDCWRR
jgi:hypothetical protein